MSITILGETTYRSEGRRFGIRDADRLQHTYILGKTGTGKSTLLRNMILQDIWRGKGTCVIDPHGDLVEDILYHLPKHRTNEVIYFNAADTHNPIAFNPLEQVDPRKASLSVSMIVDSFKSAWSDSWGPRLEYLLYQTLSLLSENQDTTLLGVERVLNDEKYRNRLTQNCRDPFIRNFWTKEFPKIKKDAFGSIQNKVGGLLSRKTLRHILGQSQSSFSPRKAIERGQIVLVNLSKGDVGSDVAHLLGALLIASIQMGAMSRKGKRDHFALFIDEFQNFTSGSLPEILSESRKYGLSLTLAHQYVDQLPAAIRKAVFGNVGTTISFRLGHHDASILSREFGIFGPEDFTNLERFHIYLRLAIDGETCVPFSAKTLAPMYENVVGGKETIVYESKRKFSKCRKKVEHELEKWFDGSSHA